VPFKRLLTALAVVTTAVVAIALPASAHVTVNPSEAAQGGFTKLTFRVPNESDTAATVSVAVEFPEEQPVTLRVKPVPGWTADVETRTVDGETSTATITWSGGRIEPGEFQEFDVSGGPMPDDADDLVMPAVQTYSDGEVVRWIDETPANGEEPEHPAPTLALVPAADGEDAHGGGGGDEAAADAEDDDDSDNGGSDGLAIAAIVLSFASLVVAVIAVALSGRKRDTTL
jgi:periplasmic copper chaperone A